MVSSSTDAPVSTASPARKRRSRRRLICLQRSALLSYPSRRVDVEAQPFDTTDDSREAERHPAKKQVREEKTSEIEKLTCTSFLSYTRQAVSAQDKEVRA